MVTREQALEILRRVKQNKPAEFFKRVTNTDSGMGCVLIYLSENDNKVYASSISEAMNISRARMAVLLKKMEMRGLISKTNSDEDARIGVISITSKGLQAVNEMQEKAVDHILTIINKVGLDEINKFIDIAEKIKRAIKE